MLDGILLYVDLVAAQLRVTLTESFDDPLQNPNPRRSAAKTRVLCRYPFSALHMRALSYFVSIVKIFFNAAAKLPELSAFAFLKLLMALASWIGPATQKATAPMTVPQTSVNLTANIPRFPIGLHIPRCPVAVTPRTYRTRDTKYMPNTQLNPIRRTGPPLISIRPAKANASGTPSMNLHCLRAAMRNRSFCDALVWHLRGFVAR